MSDHIIIDEHHPAKIKDILQKGLREYNYAFFGEYELKPFAMYIENNSSEIIAGLSGFVLSKHNVLRLEYVWVREDSRKQKLGTTLFKRLDEYAALNACKTIQASTMAFQGPFFYKKMGFKQIGTIPKWFCDRDEIFFVKELT